MKLFFTNRYRGPVTVLEVGTWFGEGSTRVFLETLPPGSTLVLVDSWAPYASREDLRKGAFYQQMDGLMFPALSNALQVAERLGQDRGIKVIVTRGATREVLPLLTSNAFDAIYLDGSHYFEDCMFDFKEARRLVRPGGIVCGDDLELPLTPELLDRARARLDEDYVEGFHPGVAVAVAECFESVQMDAGFWWAL